MMLDADCVISVPASKTHLSMVFTCAVKNMKGAVNARTTPQDALRRVGGGPVRPPAQPTPPALSIVDMVRPQEGLGPMGSGVPVDFGCIVAGTDALAIYATCCRMAA